MTERILGLILAGGLSRRMGGVEKALIPLAGRTMLARVIERLAPQCDGLVLNANGDPARFSAYGLSVLADDVPGFAGPLAGVLAGLDHAARERPDCGAIVSVAADAPFLPRDLAARLREARDADGAELAVAASGGRTHPVIALWPVAIREALRRALVEEDVRKIDRFTARYRVATAQWPAAPRDPFFNVNSPEDLSAAEALARE